MTTNTVYPEGMKEGRGAIQLAGGVLEVESFTSPGVRYKVHPNGWCACPRYQKTGYCKKHPILAEAIREARKRRFGSEVAEARVTELCKQIFAPLKKERPADSYNLLLKVLASRYSTASMIREAHRKHGRALAMLKTKRAA